MAFTYSFTGLDTPFVPGVEKAYSVTAQSSVPVADFGRFKFTFSGPGLAAGDVTTTYDDGAGNYLNLPLNVVGGQIVGYFGPGTGMQYDTLPHTSNFKSVWTPTNAGTYTLKVEFVRVSDGANIGGSQTVSVSVLELKANSTVEVDPISRIEGHLGVKLTTGADGTVTDADVHGNLWRGFENFLIGRNPNDAITFTQRICGVCPVPHGTTATFAVDAVYGYNDNFQTFSTVTDAKGIPPKALHIRNLVLSAEFLMSSLTHFYHLAAPSYVQGPNMPPWTPYFNDSFYHPLLLSAGHGTNGAGGTGVLPLEDEGFSVDLWSAVIKQYVKALRIRRLTFEAGALFAGRMPMTSTLIAGGVTFDKSEDLSAKCDMFLKLITEVGQFVVREYVPVVLALGALYPNYDNLDNAELLNSVNSGALWELASAANVGVAPSAGNTAYGAGCGNFLSWGAFPQTNGALGVPRGFMMNGDASATGISAADVTSATGLREHVTHSRYDYTSATALAAGYTADGISDPSKVNRTIPDRAGAGKYSWLKAPRWNGAPMEVGPLARLMVAGVFKVGQSLATTVPGYGAYTKSALQADASTASGLDPVMIGADLAVALVRSTLATLTVSIDLGSGVQKYVVDDAVIATLTKAQILAAYTNSTAVITGVAAAWVTNLTGGLSNMDRLRARAVESLVLVQQMIGAVSKAGGNVSFQPLVPAASASRPTNTTHPTWGWLQQLNWEDENAAGDKETYIHKAAPVAKTFGFGATEAPRGALMHMATVEKQKLIAYQCIVPTTWNASPKGAGASPANGPMEQAMIGIPYSAAKTPFTGGGGTAMQAGGGVEALRVAQSFDPCIACAVH